MLLCCHLNIPGEFSLGAVSADGLGEVSLGVAPGVGRGHLYGHHPCIVVTWFPAIMKHENGNIALAMSSSFCFNGWKVLFGGKGKENKDLCWLPLESKWIFMPLFVDENALYLSLSFVIFHSSSREAPLSVLWNNSTNHLIILLEFLFWRGGEVAVLRTWCVMSEEDSNEVTSLRPKVGDMSQL